MVFTLPNGSALAAASMSCAQKSDNLADRSPPTGVTTSADTWMRYRLDAYSINQSGGPVSGITFGGKWYRVDVNGIATEVTPNGNPQPISGSYYYALVDYSTYPTTGAIGSVYPAKSPIDNPIAGASCWNSLLSTALTSNVIN